jgi:hypothetical protein
MKTKTRRGLHTLFRKKLPEMLISSQRTTTIFWPLRTCLEIMEARRPSKWPLPSMTMGVEEKVAISAATEAQILGSASTSSAGLCAPKRRKQREDVESVR